MKRIAVYPGTFDPITNGHVDLVKRAATLFDGIVVAVATSLRKTPCFSLEDRLVMSQQACSEFNNVTVLPFAGLLVDFAREQQATIILRGLRAMSDFDYEFQQAGMNHKMAADIETVFLPAGENTAYISGTMVREIISLDGDVSPFVPPIVLQYLQK